MIVENDELAALRDSTSKALLAMLWLHLPIALAISLMRGADWIVPTLVVMAMALAATLSWQAAGNGLSTRLVFAVALVADVAMFTYQLSGHPWQSDSHMYFFAALACLGAYCDYRPIMAGTVAVALHHLVLNYVFTAAVYPGGSDLGRVVLHAVILLIEAGVLSWLAVTLSQLFETTAEKTTDAQNARAAEARANADRLEAERHAKQQADAARRELAAGFERKIGSIVAAVGVAARDMQAVSASLSNSHTETSRKTAAAAGASSQASANVQTVASATKELSASINNIAERVPGSAAMAAKAAADAPYTNTVVE